MIKAVSELKKGDVLSPTNRSVISSYPSMDAGFYNVVVSDKKGKRTHYKWNSWTLVRIQEKEEAPQ